MLFPCSMRLLRRLTLQLRSSSHSDTDNVECFYCGADQEIKRDGNMGLLMTRHRKDMTERSIFRLADEDG